MTENGTESSLINRYSEFLRGLRRSDKKLFQEIILDIESHYYMFSSSKTTLIEDLLLGFLLNQKRLTKLQEAFEKLQKSLLEG
ncbi:MAG: hypothetical protein HeimC3_05950 [Candidatus Heimdallarchaeota archaeon LC_3]|nr:MAG: hypothetical protein HeimC3_05950 [Candidatus Heimdallarchaeota archaeon LC_3]